MAHSEIIPLDNGAFPYRALTRARGYLAAMAQEEYPEFAAEVRAGCWDHRGEIQRFLLKAEYHS